MLHRSRFVIAIEGIRDDENILYDVLSRRYVGVSDAVLSLIASLEKGVSPDEGDEAEICRALVEQGFLVEHRGIDDERLRLHLEASAKGIPGAMYVTLMPTLACNLACTYCFQNGSPAYNRMSRETEDATLEFILRKVDEAATPKLIVHYFGGEPLTRKDVLIRSAEVFHASMAARGGSFEWEITTNGVSLDRPFVEAMNQFGRGTIKVTLDGDKETHDAARIYRNGKGSFDVIFDNVVAVASAGLTRLRIGGNFLPDQEESYARLVHKLEEAGVLGKLDAIKFKPIAPTAANMASPSDGVSGVAAATCTTCASPKREAEVMVRLDRLVRKKRPEAKSETIDSIGGICELHWDNQFIIDPDGLVYKCPAVAGRPEVAIGSVTSASLKGAPLLELRPWEKCGDCAYMPICVGGCLGGKYLETGRRDEVNCKKEQFEASLRETVTRRYLNELGAAPWDGDGGEATADGPRAAHP